MKLKTSLRALVGAALLSTLLFSCRKDRTLEANLSKIESVELGHDDQRRVEAGEELHVEALLYAPGLIEKINVVLIQKDGDYRVEHFWEGGKYGGLREVEWHEHLEIPSDAPAGLYEFLLQLYDRQGRVVEYESEILITAPQS